MSGTAEDDGTCEIRGCVFPKRFHYDIENHMWYEPLTGGLVRLGMTMVGPALADYRIFAFTPKRVGRAVEAQKSCATIEWLDENDFVGCYPASS